MRLLRAPRRRQASRADNGFTLVEVLVAMLVLGVIFAVIPMILSTTTKVTVANSARLTAMSQARVAVESTARLLRTAVVPKQLGGDATDAFISGGDFSVKFYADIDNPDNSIGPSQVTLTESGGTLVQTVQPPDTPTINHNYVWTPCVPGAAGCSIKRTILATNVDDDSPIFTYYQPDEDGVEQVLTGAEPFDATDMGNVNAIEVRITVDKSSTHPMASSIAADTYITRVALINRASLVKGQGNGT